MGVLARVADSVFAVQAHCRFTSEKPLRSVNCNWFLSVSGLHLFGHSRDGDVGVIQLVATDATYFIRGDSALVFSVTLAQFS